MKMNDKGGMVTFGVVLAVIALLVLVVPFLLVANHLLSLL
jgi:hypothetical protein